MKVLLLDADGVVLKKGEYFSEIFARENNLPLDSVVPLFRDMLPLCQEGKRDLKKESETYFPQWNWQGTAEDFLELWFKDIVPDEKIISAIAQLRKNGVACYMASNNEQYRAKRIRETLGNALDGYFFSSDLKFRKANPEFFRLVLETLQVLPAEVMYIDNDQKNIDAALTHGIDAKLYTGVEIFKTIIN